VANAWYVEVDGRVHHEMEPVPTERLDTASSVLRLAVAESGAARSR
jgi:hypothetical protein